MGYSVILLCAGQGTRTGLKYNKMFYKLEEYTVYETVIHPFLIDSRCKQVVVVCKENEVDDLKAFVYDERITYVFGGKERSDSVYNGLQVVSEDYVLIHDGARPYLTNDLIDNIIESVKINNACLLMVPCKDTIKRVVDGYVEETLNRSELMQAQTPQAFKTILIKDAYQKAHDSGYQATDDSQLYEHYEEGKVAVVLGDYNNLKITTKEDLK